MKFNGIG